MKKLNKTVSLRATDKIPYGCFYAFDNLPALFPKAGIQKNLQSPASLYYDTADAGDEQIQLKTYIIIGPKILPDKDELETIIRFAGSGHQVFMSSLYFGGNLLNALHLKISRIHFKNDSLNLRLVLPGRADSINYRYPGFGWDAYFESYDTAHTLVLGWNSRGNPDFIRIGFNHGGAIFVHLAPLAFTNFFLLYGQNKSYYDIALSYLPRKTNTLLWDDYFRKKEQEKFSILHFILGNRSLRWAFWLLVILFGILYAVESKRKQRALASRPALANSSVDFVKTIGRLYLQQKDNQNLAIKMITAFLEHIRLNYHLQTSALNDEFATKLALRTGFDLVTVKKLVGSIHYARMQPAFTDQELLDLHQQMEIFNNPHKHMEENLFTERTDLQAFRETLEKLKQEIGKVIVGQEQMIELLIAGILADGHVLIEGVPGVAKTLTAKLLSRTISVGFSRIQFTPDLMPGDVIGTSVFNPRELLFQFRQGPIFSHIVLIDEINRAPAKTQAALFEVMEERQITVDGQTMKMQQPFLVVATQNPIEQEGTYHLPEAQLDRFLFKIRVDYPSAEDEYQVVMKHHNNRGSLLEDQVSPVLTAAVIADLRRQVNVIHVEEKLIRFIVSVVGSTRGHKSIYLGASPRASIGILQASKAIAAMHGRDFVVPEDILYVMPAVLRHRLVLTPEKEMEGGTADDVIRELIQAVEIPR